MAGLVVDPSAALRDAIEHEFSALRRAIELYVVKLGLAADREAAVAAADEVLQEVVARALRRADRFDPSRSALAWLRGFAVNVIREQLDARRNRQRHEATLARSNDKDADEPVDPLEHVYDLAAEEGYRLVELLDLVGPVDRTVLDLRFIQKLDGPALAQALGVQEGAARVRLSRALSRLRAAYHQAEEERRRSIDR